MKIILLILEISIFLGFTACNNSPENVATNSNSTEITTKKAKPVSILKGFTQLPSAPDTLSIALTRFRNGNQQNVEASETFIKQDGIKLTVSMVEKGFVTIIYKASNSSSQILFPNKEYSNGQNGVEPHQNIVIPNKGWFFFDEKKGTETVYVVYSKNQFPKVISNNAEESVKSLEKLRSDNNNADSFINKDNDLVRVIELNHN